MIKNVLEKMMKKTTVNTRMRLRIISVIKKEKNLKKEKGEKK